jgi:hypothetical protein
VSVHHSRGKSSVRGEIQEIQCQFIILARKDEPTPDYAPKVKQGLRRVGARAKAELYDALGEALRRVTPEDILGWFRHAGLCATHE